jgi:hypothetical protein
MFEISKALIVCGIIAFASGVVFSLQSKSVLGPNSSFMYANPEWTVNGSIIIVSGLITIALGGLAVLLAKRRSPG